MHVHAGNCPLCGRDYFVMVIPTGEPCSLGTFDMYHLESACELLPVEPARRD
jgi:hypothetical protein